MNTTYTPQPKYNARPQAADISEYVFGKVPPHSDELEQAVLGACLLDAEAFPAIVDILKPESFYTEAHREIYRAFVHLFATQSPIDLLTVTEHLRTAGKLPQVGTSVYLVELSNMVASAANLEYHARIIAQKALMRDLIALSQTAIKTAYEDGDPFDLLHDTQKRLFELTNFSGRNALPASQIGVEVLRKVERAMRIGDGLTGVPTGIKILDEITGGWQPSDLVIIAARPGMGKTAFVLCCMLHAAKQGIPVGMFSLEMGRDQLFQRLVAMETGISSNRIQRGKLTMDEFNRVGEAIRQLSALPIHIDDTPGVNIFEMRAKARRLKMQHGIGLMVVDYIQLMSGEDKRGNREQEVSGISRGLKTTAKELEIPCLALSQLSRSVETRGGAKRPILADLRESGALEQDADIVSFIYRAEYYGITQDERGNDTKGLAELIIEKHRNGALDTIGMHFQDFTTKFSDLSETLISSQFPTARPATTPAPEFNPAAVPMTRSEDDIPF